MKTQAILNSNYDILVEMYKDIKDLYASEDFITSMYITTATLDDSGEKFYALVLFIDDLTFSYIEQYFTLKFQANTI